MNANPLAQFANQKYLSLETYRKTGAPVATPVWFAEEHGTLYIYSLGDAGKVKRIRNNSRVRIAPCDYGGKSTGEWVNARAEILDEPRAQLGHRLLDKKYWVKRIGNVFSKLRRTPRAVIAITVD